MIHPTMPPIIKCFVTLKLLKMLLRSICQQKKKLPCRFRLNRLSTLERTKDEHKYHIVDHNIQGQEATKITQIGMLVNMAMASCKGAAGLSAGSTALLADAAHSMSDLLSDFVTLWAVKVARLPPDNNHPYGYGKFEAVGSLSVGAILVTAGCGIGYEGLSTLTDILSNSSAPIITPTLFTSFSREEQLGLAAGTAIASIAAKEALYQATVKIGKKTKSKVLVANAWHHRTDALSSIVALAGICGSLLSIPIMDPLAGVAVACMISKTGVEICLDSVRELTDKSVEVEVLEALSHTIRKVDDVISASNVRARRMGPYTLVDLRIHVHNRLSISAAQQVSDRVKNEILLEVPDVSEVLVHLDVEKEVKLVYEGNAKLMQEDSMRPSKEIQADVYQALEKIPEILGCTHVNAHWVSYQSGYGTLVDIAIVVDKDMTVRNAHEVARKARSHIERISYIAEADIHLELYDKK